MVLFEYYSTIMKIILYTCSFVVGKFYIKALTALVNPIPMSLGHYSQISLLKPCNLRGIF